MRYYDAMRRLRSALYYFLLLAIVPGIAPPLHAGMAPVIVRYSMDVRLTPDDKTLAGTEKINYYNISADTLTELQFHLYLNAFKNKKSTFMRESGRHRDVPEYEEGKEGWTTITEITVNNSVELSASLEYIQPDDNNTDDQTLARIPLSAPLLPGDSALVQISFSARLPKVIARSGYYGDFFYAAQWYPKLAKYEGGKGWNSHQYHASSEYFADFGIFDVRITTPADFIVGATGEQLSRQENSDGTATCRYYQEDVHDFAWTASPDFIEAKDVFAWQGRPDVQVRLLLQPEHEGYAGRYFRALKASLTYVATYLDPYPYATLTLVDPPHRSQSGFGGMEYPTIIVAGARLLSPAGVMRPEGVTIHEFLHEYFYGIVASNEFEEAWLDEGMTSYFTIKVIEEEYGAAEISTQSMAGLSLPGWRMFGYGPFPFISYWDKIMGVPYAHPSHGFYEFAGLDPMVSDSWDFYSRSSYVNSVYAKPELMLQTIENYLGKELMRDIMRTYFLRWRFRHPTSNDFLEILREKAPAEVVHLAEEMLYGTGTVDYAVGIVSADSIGTESPGQFRSEITLKRLGAIVFPVDVLFKFEDGEEITETWDGTETWKDYNYVKASPVISVTIDPEDVLAIEHNITNNSMSRKPVRKTVLRWSLEWLFWMQSYLFHSQFFM